jgi:hypothetical protein
MSLLLNILSLMFLNKRMEGIIVKNKILQIMALIVFITALLTSCASPVNPTAVPTTYTDSTPQATQLQLTSREAQVQSVEIQTLQTDPLQINAVVHGNLTESCATLGESQVQYSSDTIGITVYAVSRSDIGCMQATTTFETTIPLNTKDLSDGTYTVIANGVSVAFTLPTINPTSGPAPTAATAPTSSACVDSAMFMSDVTIPDNTVFTPNIPFTKTWRLKNTGTCNWDGNYLVAYISGSTMSQQPGYWIVPEGQIVSPGQTLDVSVGMTSPVENGNYASYWGLKKVDGGFMPIQGGANGNSFFVKIKVNNGAVEGKITDQFIAIELEQGSGTVCTVNSTYLVHASISADGATTAAYEIGSTAGQIPAGYFQTSPTGPVSLYLTGTLTFDQAGTKTMDYRFVGPYPYPNDITVNLKVNGGEWHNTKLSCQS